VVNVVSHVQSTIAALVFSLIFPSVNGHGKKKQEEEGERERINELSLITRTTCVETEEAGGLLRLGYAKWKGG
jgi:hypothetical protein